MKLFRQFFGWLMPHLPLKFVIDRYIAAGSTVGLVCSYSYLGEPYNMADLVERWSFWEKEVVRRGYVPHALDAFIGSAGYDVALPKLQKATTTSVVLHAPIYEKYYLGKVQPLINWGRTEDGVLQMGTYRVPSTTDPQSPTYE